LLFFGVVTALYRALSLWPQNWLLLVARYVSMFLGWRFLSFCSDFPIVDFFVGATWAHIAPAMLGRAVLRPGLQLGMWASSSISISSPQFAAIGSLVGWHVDPLT
jgi:hypothetical protein